MFTLDELRFGFTSNLPIELTVDYGDGDGFYFFPDSKTFREFMRERKDLHDYVCSVPSFLKSHMYGGKVVITAWKNEEVETGA